MKNLYLIFFFLVVHITLFSDGIEREKNAKAYFISTPRSGSHWLSYSLTTLSGHRVTWAEHSKTEAIYNKDLSYIIQAHEHADPNNFSDGDKLILLTRNHLDSLIRNYETYENLIRELKKIHMVKEKHPNIKFPASHNKEFIHWTLLYEQLAHYDNWDPKTRLLVYYEELVKNPKEVFNKIMHFLGEKDWPIDEYLKNIHKHKKIVREFYLSQPFGACNSDGLELHPYSKKLTPDQIDEINALMRKLDPELFQKYLKNCKFLITRNFQEGMVLGSSS